MAEKEPFAPMMEIYVAQRDVEKGYVRESPQWIPVASDTFDRAYGILEAISRGAADRITVEKFRDETRDHIIEDAREILMRNGVAQFGQGSTTRSHEKFKMIRLHANTQPQLLRQEVFI